MQAPRVETTVQADGTVVLRHLPLRPGEAVEVIILVQGPVMEGNDTSLRGLPLTYERPFDPVDEDQWQAVG